MNGARLLVETLEQLGVDLVFGYPGGAILPVYDALVDSRLTHVLTRHEQGAAFAADGYARVSGRPGVCIATSGPGATNLVTGIANAYLDSVPVVALTGQVSTALMGTDAFQEVDIFGMTMPIVKHSFLVRDPEQIGATVREAFSIATSGRPGPVLVDLPKDVASAEVTNRTRNGLERVAPLSPDATAIARARELLSSSRSPVIYAGGGIGMARAVEEFRGFVETTGVPVASTLKGLGSIPTDHPLSLGMLGMHGTRAANFAIEGCDLLLCVGARFDDRATGKLAAFAPRAAVVHLDVDPAEVSKLRQADVALLGDLRQSLPQLARPLNIEPWRAHCRQLVADHPLLHDPPTQGVYAPTFLRELSQTIGDDIVLACDVGQHQMWVAQHCRIPDPHRHLTSGGLGAMGYGLPAGIGAQLADPDATVVVVSGDGSFMMNVQELVTVRRLGLPLKIVVLDNSALGMVRQWQELFHDERYSEINLSDNPDFAAVARSLGIDAFTVHSREDVPAAIERLHRCSGPVLAHVRIDPRQNVWPLVPPGAGNSTMMAGPGK